MGDYNSELLALPMAESPGYVDQFLRTLGYAYYGLSDVAEVYAIGHRITAENADSWFEAWNTAASGYLDVAEGKLAAGHRVSAQRAFLRAAEYHRASHFFLREDLSDPRLRHAVSEMRRAADGAFALARGHTVRRIVLPFEDARLHGLAYLRGGEETTRRPTLLVLVGYDSFAEEYHALAFVEDMVARGYNLVVVEGPGQGQTLLREGLTMRPDAEAFVRPALDWVMAQGWVDPGRVAVIGRSFGGYLAPRGLLGDDRPCALIVDPGQISFRGAVVGAMPEPVRTAFAAEDAVAVNGFFAKAMAEKPGLRFFFGSRAAVHGCATPYDYCREMLRYDFSDRAGEITVPTLCTDNPYDFATRGTALFDALVNVETKELVRFETEYADPARRCGGGAHCEQGFNLPFEMRAADWLSALIGHRDEL